MRIVLSSVGTGSSLVLLFDERARNAALLWADLTPMRGPAPRWPDVGDGDGDVGGGWPSGRRRW
jgi:hypothetical protein